MKQHQKDARKFWSGMATPEFVFNINPLKEAINSLGECVFYAIWVVLQVVAIITYPVWFPIKLAYVISKDYYLLSIKFHQKVCNPRTPSQNLRFANRLIRSRYAATGLKFYKEAYIEIHRELLSRRLQAKEHGAA